MKARVGHGHAGWLIDFGLAPAYQTQEGKGHVNAMIILAVDACAPWAATLYFKAIGVLLKEYPHGGQAICHGLDAIALLLPEARGASKGGLSGSDRRQGG